MLDFADHFLKGKDNGWEATPSVRYETMDDYYQGNVQQSDMFLPENTEYTKLYIGKCKLQDRESKEAGKATIQWKKGQDNQLRFNYTFTKEAVITGHIKAQLFVETTKGNDLDLFIELDKLDARGQRLSFAVHGSDQDGFADGLLRASQRTLNAETTSSAVPKYTFMEPKLLKAGEMVQLDIYLSATSVRFDAGETLSLVISNRDINHTSARHADTVNQGDTILSFGGKHDPYLQLPIAQ